MPPYGWATYRTGTPRSGKMSRDMRSTARKHHQCDGYDHRQKRDGTPQRKRHQVHRDASAGSARARTTKRASRAKNGKLVGRSEEIRLIFPSSSIETQRRRVLSRTWRTGLRHRPLLCSRTPRRFRGERGGAVSRLSQIARLEATELRPSVTLRLTCRGSLQAARVARSVLNVPFQSSIRA